MEIIKKACISEKKVALEEFERLNKETVKLVKTNTYFGTIILTNSNPDTLIYPEGWYNEHGTFRSKLDCHEESEMVTYNGTCWRELSNYTVF